MTNLGGWQCCSSGQIQSQLFLEELYFKEGRWEQDPQGRFSQSINQSNNQSIKQSKNLASVTIKIVSRGFTESQSLTTKMTTVADTSKDWSGSDKKKDASKGGTKKMEAGVQDRQGWVKAGFASKKIKMEDGGVSGEDASLGVGLHNLHSPFSHVAPINDFIPVQRRHFTSGRLSG